MSDPSNSDDEQWHERLMMACHNDGNSIQEEHDFFREEAAAAPFEALELFLSSPEGKYEGPARAVMAQVYQKRANRLQQEKARREGRAEWWRGLAQQVSAQIIGALLVGIFVGFVTGVWFSCS
ncbi:hypothetical protein [Billgrantia gudaonensis]|uniref:hypothetical protein n=1 Tax=Billgrantia gudaonensis TaxID=376427 RepID=UPI00115F8DEE|nr:hypothetical protein [Halomonas gudaonensis]